jgi:hypothetical protein
LNSEVDFLKKWGPTTEFDEKAGILQDYAKFVRKNYKNITDSLMVIK